MRVQKLATWFVGLTALLILSNVVLFGLMSIFRPDLPWPSLGGGEADFPIQFFAVRHLAFGIVLIRALVSKDLIMLKTLYHLFLLISIFDIALLAWKGYYIPLLVNLVGETSALVSALIALGIFLVPMGLGLKYIHTELQKNQG